MLYGFLPTGVSSVHNTKFIGNTLILVNGSMPSARHLLLELLTDIFTNENLTIDIRSMIVLNDHSFNMRFSEDALCIEKLLELIIRRYRSSIELRHSFKAKTFSF